MSEIAIVHTNDVHCAFSASFVSAGYAGVLAQLHRAQKQYGSSNACLVDCGDFIGGGAAGALSRGQSLVELMTRCGYAAACPGNADFSYGVERLEELSHDAEFSIVCCNLLHAGTREPVFAPFTIKQLGDARVAFVGVITPNTPNAMDPDCFCDEAGRALYDFCQDDDGAKLYKCVQNAVDEARQQGADCVVLLAHLGQEGQVSRWTSDELVRNTSGIDAVLDGHSHETFSQRVKNNVGREVVIAQCGMMLSSVGTLVIDTETHEVRSAVVGAESIEPDAVFNAVANDLADALASKLEVKVGYTQSRLVARREDGKSWLVRNCETNLGNLVADAYRAALDADVAFAPAWVMRETIPAGTIAIGSLYATQPLGNHLSSALVTGKQIADMLEYAARSWPQANAGFAHVSGMTYCIDANIASSVKTDAANRFLEVAGPRRVTNVRVMGEPLDLQRTYTIATVGFILSRGGNGFAMFEGSQLVQHRAILDVDALADFIGSYADGDLKGAYANERGTGRIKIIQHDISAEGVSTD